ncbi:ubiquitin-protein ligase peroxin 12 [Zalaria obscura]|uniref:Ubiquitin-protein ligase peroxin 12 n=1 Tax=Zalaria obscura TaxID=2024903 RepID=A0ACC3SNN0_9PEZI
MEFMTSLQSGLDTQKPSLFELLSEQQLNALIPPSLRYLLARATHRHPRYLLPLLNSFDELYALLSLLIERHYLHTHAASFTESFYGLKRERVLRIRSGESPRAALGAPEQLRESLKLRPADVWRNLAVVVALPYLKRKLDESYDIHAAGASLLGPAFADRDALPRDATLRQRFLWAYKWFLRRVYPSVNAAYYFALLAFHLAYLFDGSKYSSPFLWLVGTRMRRVGEADLRAVAMAQAKPRRAARPGQGNSIFSPRTLGQAVVPAIMGGLKVLLPTSIFALKFLEWWHASDFARQLGRKAAEGLELPPPTISGLPAPAPAPAEKRDGAAEKDGAGKEQEAEAKATSVKPPISSVTGLPILTVPPPSPDTSDLCPICRSPVQTPTATQTGFVFCYTCIFRWVDGEHARQEAFMEGSGGEDEAWVEEGGGSRVGKWESGKGRCAVTGRRLLGGTGGLRRVMV